MAFTKSFLKPPLTFPAVSGDICSFVDKLGGFPLKAHEVSLVAKQAAGTPSPSSPLPISGEDSIHIQNTAGINQWDEQWEVGTYDASGQKSADNRMIRSKNFISIKPSTTYYVQSANVAFVYFLYDIDKNFIGTNYLTNSTFTSPANAYYMNFRTSADYGNVYHNDISINYPSTDTSYHAFVGQSITVQIGSTVYGGTFDAITGILTVTHIYIKPSSTATISSFSHTANNTWIFVIQGFSAVTRGDAISNINIVDTYGNTTGNGFCKATTNYPVFSLNDADNNLNVSSSAADIRTAFANFVNTYSPEAVYELATPEIIQLSPAQILTLKNNNVWADTGATSLQYIKIGR